MQLQINLDMDNDAFTNDAYQRATEASRAINECLRRFVSDGMRIGDVRSLADINGNTIGKAKVIP